MIREIKKEDLNEINVIGSSIKDNFNSYYDIENVFDSDYKKIYVIDENKIMGFIFIEDHIDFVDIIAIATIEFNRGYGTKLLEYIIQNNKGKNILLEVRNNNTNAINLYNKFNFKEINRRKRYYENDDAIIMEAKN